MTSAEEFTGEDQRQSVEALESLWWSQMRIARWLAQQPRAEEPPPHVDAAAAEARLSRSGAGERTPTPRR